MGQKLYRTKRIPHLVAIVGGSGAGKTWLALQLKRRFGKEAVVLSLDNFYKDRSHLSPARRHRLNFDRPHAIDWNLLRDTLDKYARGEKVALPNYDFATHTRSSRKSVLPRRRILILEGLWLLRPAWLRRLFSARVFVDCHETVRLERRVKRDQAERGRAAAAVCDQFNRCVAPMHARYVAPQQRWADWVLSSPINNQQVGQLIADIKNNSNSSYDKRKR